MAAPLQVTIQDDKPKNVPPTTFVHHFLSGGYALVDITPLRVDSLPAERLNFLRTALAEIETTRSKHPDRKSFTVPFDLSAVPRPVQPVQQRPRPQVETGSIPAEVAAQKQAVEASATQLKARVFQEITRIVNGLTEMPACEISYRFRSISHDGRNFLTMLVTPSQTASPELVQKINAIGKSILEQEIPKGSESVVLDVVMALNRTVPYLKLEEKHAERREEVQKGPTEDDLAKVDAALAPIYKNLDLAIQKAIKGKGDDIRDLNSVQVNVHLTKKSAGLYSVSIGSLALDGSTPAYLLGVIRDEVNKIKAPPTISIRGLQNDLVDIPILHKYLVTKEAAQGQAAQVQAGPTEAQKAEFVQRIDGALTSINLAVDRAIQKAVTALGNDAKDLVSVHVYIDLQRTAPYPVAKYAPIVRIELTGKPGTDVSGLKGAIDKEITKAKLFPLTIPARGLPKELFGVAVTRDHVFTPKLNVRTEEEHPAPPVQQPREEATPSLRPWDSTYTFNKSIGESPTDIYVSFTKLPDAPASVPVAGKEMVSFQFNFEHREGSFIHVSLNLPVYYLTSKELPNTKKQIEVLLNKSLDIVEAQRILVIFNKADEAKKIPSLLTGKTWEDQLPKTEKQKFYLQYERDIKPLPVAGTLFAPVPKPTVKTVHDQEEDEDYKAYSFKISSATSAKHFLTFTQQFDNSKGGKIKFGSEIKSVAFNLSIPIDPLFDPSYTQFEIDRYISFVRGELWAAIKSTVTAQQLLSPTLGKDAERAAFTALYSFSTSNFDRQIGALPQSKNHK